MIRNIIIFTLIIPFLTHAQKDTIRVKYNSQISGFYDKGNNNNLFLSANNYILLENSKIRNSFIYNYNYGEQTYVKNQDEHYVNNMISYKLRKKLYIPALVEFERSFMRSINDRISGGIGIGLTISKSASITYLFIVDKTDYIDSYLLVYRNSLRLKVNYEHNNFKFKSDTYVQPDFEGKYFRFRTNTSFGYKISKVMAIILSFQDSYEQYTINNKINNDFNTSIGISITNF